MLNVFILTFDKALLIAFLDNYSWLSCYTNTPPLKISYAYNYKQFFLIDYDKVDEVLANTPKKKKKKKPPAVPADDSDDFEGDQKSGNKKKKDKHKTTKKNTETQPTESGSEDPFEDRKEDKKKPKKKSSKTEDIHEDQSHSENFIEIGGSRKSEKIRIPEKDLRELLLRDKYVSDKIIGKSLIQIIKKQTITKN